MPRQNHGPVTDEQKQAFLDALAAGTSVTEAAPDPAYRRKLYRLRKRDPEFDAAWSEAWQEGGEPLLNEARRRAVEGVSRRWFDKDGNLWREEIVYSDSLLMFLIKQRDPSFRERSTVEHTGKDGGAIQVEIKEARERLAARLDDIAQRRGTD